MTTQEERLVLELHVKWGNRWSKIARKLPGRTDNEIKNYWRTHMRKKAQETRRGVSSSSSSSSSSASFTSSHNPAEEFAAETGAVKFFDSGGSEISGSSSSTKKNQANQNQELGGDPNGYSMDDIWKDIDLSDHESLIMNSPPSWGSYCGDSLWKRIEEEEETKLIFSGYDHNNNQANQNFFY